MTVRRRNSKGLLKIHRFQDMQCLPTCLSLCNRTFRSFKTRALPGHASSAVVLLLSIASKEQLGMGPILRHDSSLASICKLVDRTIKSTCRLLLLLHHREYPTVLLVDMVFKDYPHLRMEDHPLPLGAHLVLYNLCRTTQRDLPAAIRTMAFLLLLKPMNLVQECLLVPTVRVDQCHIHRLHEVEQWLLL